MFRCASCEHEGDTFHVAIVGSDQGGFKYRAKCPECGSLLVKVLPGVKKEDLRIITKKE